MSASRAVSAWLPVVAWAALIFTLSSIPDLGTGLEGWDLVLRKAAHLAEYAVLGGLLVRALDGAPPFLSFQRETAVTWGALALGSLYAASDELHQHFVPGRQGSALDFALDAVGIAVGVVAIRLASR